MKTPPVPCSLLLTIIKIWEWDHKRLELSVAARKRVFEANTRKCIPFSLPPAGAAYMGLCGRWRVRRRGLLMDGGTMKKDCFVLSSVTASF